MIPGDVHSASSTGPSSDSRDMTPFPLQFPKGFLWGVSTASYQVEGGNDNCQWARWESAGRIRSAGDRSGFACDCWRNAEADFDLARAMHLNALRLSVEWSRIEPRPGEWNDSALDRYRAMLAALHERGLRPFVCLHHFTNPIWFEEEGGFANARCVQRFGRFANHVVERLGGLCSDWVTFNEPNVYAMLGYLLGEFPPGERAKFAKTHRVLANMARAHATAYRVIHQAQPAARVGWTHNYMVFQPVRP